MLRQFRAATWGLGAVALLAAAALAPVSANAARKPTTTTSPATTTTTNPGGGGMLGPSSIVQVNGGNSGGSRVTTLDLGFTAPVRTDTHSLLIVATDLANIAQASIPMVTDPQDWLNLWESAGAFGQANSPYIITYLAFRTEGLYDNWGGGTTWTATFPSAVAVSWIAVEVSGLLSGANPNDSFAAANSFNNSGSATSIDTTNGGRPAEHDDDFLLAAFASRVASGTPPTVTGVANTTGQPGMWAELSASQATSNAAGANVRLDVYFKFTAGQPGTYDATASYSAASFLVGLIGGLVAQPVTDRPGATVVA